MAKPKTKRLEPRPYVEAERDAYDLVREVISLVLDAHASKLNWQEQRRLIMRGDLYKGLLDAIARGTRRALADEIRARNTIPFLAAIKRQAMKTLDLRDSKNLLEALGPDRDLVKAWAINRMHQLVHPPPLFGDGDPTPSDSPLSPRKAAESVAAQLGDTVKAERIRSWYRIARKR